MKSQQRHQLKQNEFAAGVVRLSEAARGNGRRLAIAVLAVVILAGAVGGFLLWRKHTREQAGALFAAAMAVTESPIAPPSTVPGAPQAPGTFPSTKARLEAAVAAFTQVVKAYSSSPDGIAAQYEMAGALLALGRFSEAEKAYEDVVARAGSGSIYNATARMGLAEALAAQGKYDRAIKEYTDLAAARDGQLPVDGVLVQLARTYLSAGKADDARATFKRVADEFPNSSYVAEARQELARLG
jgi:TolA-binding protein